MNEFAFVLGCLFVLAVYLWHKGALTMSCKIVRGSPVKPEQLQLRPEVFAFAQMMERRLREKDAARGQSWKEMSVFGLCKAVRIKSSYMQTEIAINTRMADSKPAVDIANFCMMIADVSGQLDIGGDGLAGLNQQPDEWRCA
jgi:hypothetical protein